MACQSGSGESGGGGEGGDSSAAETTSTSSSTTSTSSFTCVTPDSPLVFEIGTGEHCFERVPAFGAVHAVEGNQGGYHVWLAFGCGDCGTVTHIKYGLRDPETHMTLEGTSVLEELVALHGKDWPQAAGLTDFLPGSSANTPGAPPPPDGTKVLLWVEAYDPKGNLWRQDEREVVVGGP